MTNFVVSLGFKIGEFIIVKHPRENVSSIYEFRFLLRKKKYLKIVGKTLRSFFSYKGEHLFKVS